MPGQARVAATLGLKVPHAGVKRCQDRKPKECARMRGFYSFVFFAHHFRRALTQFNSQRVWKISLTVTSVTSGRCSCTLLAVIFFLTSFFIDSIHSISCNCVALQIPC